ncbi:tRNA 2-selenouridine(34) synthase MnmH [Alcanivorax sp. 1008]|uniref:tRNA 2-selenouridine(34) synthase MnmH n=1 Tax=Alcanivorax sp. 1008 TaxID=2816853 RepID=UPI001D5E5B52|nr:tRNA 2-selenouridine(34) synthase MnmH [Alcanivorax sp. 1008]MCC1495389.1 tRNA 2-selenouridine(34) synthase MnmH [Alcanivorax sp. 1008]
MQRITDYRRLFLDQVPMLDVRAPVEFSGGAFPYSDNIALLNDDERHRIGICYKQHGQQAAIELGQQLVGGQVREARVSAWKEWIKQHPDGVLYCFRGGLRSQTVQQWLHDDGVDIPLVHGGYKAMRRFLLTELDNQIKQLPLLVLCGPTGSGKTRVIEKLDNSIDLEGIAHHRGSAFGRRPGGQPAQIDFENTLSAIMLKQSIANHRQIILEDESRLIGRCYLPLPLQERIRDGARVLIEESLDSRVEVTLEDYVLGPLAEYRHWFADQAEEKLGTELLDSIDRIRRRLGGARHQQLRGLLVEALKQQQSKDDTSLHRLWIKPLLRDYYDPMYDYMLQQRTGQILFQGSREDVQQWLQAAH